MPYHSYSEKNLERIGQEIKQTFENQRLNAGYSHPLLPPLKPYIREEGDTPDGPEAKFVFAIPTAEMLEALNRDE